MLGPPCFVKRKIFFDKLKIKKGVKINKPIDGFLFLVAELCSFAYKAAFLQITEDACQVGAIEA